MNMKIARTHLLSLAIAAAVANSALAQNDDCTGAISVAQGLNGPFTNVGATTSVPAWPCGSGTNDVWYSYVAPNSGVLTVDTCTANYDGVLEIFDGTAGCGALVSLGCDDDFCGGASGSQVTTNVTSGTTYYIRVGGWSGSTGTFSLNVNGPLPSGSVVATNTVTGAGCVRVSNSFYESFASATPAAPALSGNVLLLSPTGTGYQGAWLPGVAASFFVAPVAATPLATGDDGVVNYAITSAPLSTPQGLQTSLLVSGNAIITWGVPPMDYPTTNAYSPTAAGFLNSTLGGIYAWHDYNQAETGSGQIVAEEVGGVLYITFNNVENYPAGVVNPSTLQFQFNLASGVINMVFVSIDSNPTSVYGSSHLIGVTAPGASQDPGSVALATATPAQLFTNSPEVLPLLLAGVSRPITGTNWSLNVTNIPAPGMLGVDIFGVADPALLDLGLLGLGQNGCQLRSTLDAVIAYVSTGTTHAYGFAIPNNPALINFHLFTQSAVLNLPSLANTITSNGIDGKIGNL